MITIINGVRDKNSILFACGDVSFYVKKNTRIEKKIVNGN